MVSFQIPAQWVPWIEKERIRRGLRTRSDFLRKAVIQNIEIAAMKGRVPRGSELCQVCGLPKDVCVCEEIAREKQRIARGDTPTRSSPAARRIRFEIHDSLRRGVEYFSKVWGLGSERLAETLRLATRTYAHLAQYLGDREDDPDDGEEEVRTGGPGEETTAKGGKVFSDEEKATVLSSSGTAVKAVLGEIGMIDDPVYGQIPEVVLEFDLTPDIEDEIFPTN